MRTGMRHYFRFSIFSTLLLVLVQVGVATAADGPDVTVFSLPSTVNWGASGGIRGYSVGTTSCNIGNANLKWCNSTNCGSGLNNTEHPVIGQNMYRLKNGRFEQIGASWLKHGFTSLNQTSAACQGIDPSTGQPTPCTNPSGNGRFLFPGCTDPYSANLNGSVPAGRRSVVNPTTGVFPYPNDGTGDNSAPWNQRMAVAESDLTAAANPGASYFVEGQYVAPDDAQAGNGLNNASYAPATVSQPSFNVNVGATVREKPAIKAWQVADPTVEILDLDVPGSSPLQRFHVARKVTEVTPGTLWHYEYAIHNMNAIRAADGFEVAFFGAATITNQGFHDVNSHSNEPYDIADWGFATTSTSASWNALPFPSAPQNANALRWGTLYNFWFDANQGPDQISQHTLSLFETGTPESITFWSGSPPAMFIDGFE